MYRIFCESLQNYIEICKDKKDPGGYRLGLSKTLALIADPGVFKREESMQSFIYKQLSDLLIFVEENIQRFEKLKAFLWTLEARGIKGKYFGVASRQDMEEQAKLMCMFLDLLYWDDVRH